MKPKIGYAHASQSLLDSWISRNTDATAAQIFGSNLDLLGANVVLALADNDGCRIVRGYEVHGEPSSVAGSLILDFLSSRYLEALRRGRALSSKEIVVRGGLLISFHATLLPDKMGAWCIGLFGIHVVLRASQPTADVDGVDHAILQLLYGGASGKEIGIAVGLSYRTIEHRIERLKRIFEARTIAQLVALSIGCALIVPAGEVQTVLTPYGR